MLLNTTKIRNPKNPQNCRTVLSPIPIDGESRAVSKKVLTLDEAQKAKKLERCEIFDDQPRPCNNAIK